MSGGWWNYENDHAARAIFGWHMDVDYGKEGFSQGKNARRKNPLKDKQISELVWDVFCLLHSFDWYMEGDTSEETYKEDLKYFREKWLNVSSEELVHREIEKALTEAREDLYQIFGGEINETET
jgi:hypothetical protein